MTCDCAEAHGWRTNAIDGLGPGRTLHITSPFGSRYRVEYPDGEDVRPRVNAVHSPADRQNVIINSTVSEPMRTNEESGATDSTVFESATERSEALSTLAESWDATPEAVEEFMASESDVEHPEVAVFVGARKAGWQPAGCDHDNPECACTMAALGLDPADAADRENAHPAGDLSGFDDPAFLPDGGSDRQNAAAYPTGSRSDYERRQREIERGEREPRPGPGSPQRANMAAVPGAMRRNYDDRSDADPEEFPGGTRRAWERRQAGVEDVPTGDGDPPAGTRSDHEHRRTNAEGDYPLTASRKAERREERRQAAEKRRKAARKAGRRARMEQFDGGSA